MKPETVLTAMFLCLSVMAAGVVTSCQSKLKEAEAPGVTAPKPTPGVQAPSPEPSAQLDGITSVAGASSCATYRWGNRGPEPRGFIKGVALSFAKAICNSDRPEVKILYKEKGPDSSDALSWYNSNFAALGMSNNTQMDRIRHVYALLYGLGARESSGRYCCGRDMSAGFSKADSAEAGAFQASWGAKRKAPSELVQLFNRYQSSKVGCNLEVFKQGVSSCNAGDLKNWGDPSEDGYKFQALSKECPAFATEYAAVLIRVHGGTAGEFGPLRRKAAELRPECDAMLAKVQKMIEASPSLCKDLR